MMKSLIAKFGPALATLLGVLTPLVGAFLILGAETPPEAASDGGAAVRRPLAPGPYTPPSWQLEAEETNSVDEVELVDEANEAEDAAREGQTSSRSLPRSRRPRSRLWRPLYPRSWHPAPEDYYVDSETTEPKTLQGPKSPIEPRLPPESGPRYDPLPPKVAELLQRLREGREIPAEMIAQLEALNQPRVVAPAGEEDCFPSPEEQRALHREGMLEQQDLPTPGMIEQLEKLQGPRKVKPAFAQLRKRLGEQIEHFQEALGRAEQEEAEVPQERELLQGLAGQIPSF